LIVAKKHELERTIVLGVCDKELLGKEFEEGELCFTVSKRFFGESEVTTEELIELFEEADSINLFGNKCVSIAKEQGLINENKVISISGIKHVQIYKI